MTTVLHGIPTPSGDLLFQVTLENLGFQPAGIWNSSPSVENFTGYYELPHQVILGTTFEIRASASRFSPPPFAVAIKDTTGAKRALLCLAAKPGHHLFATVVFDASTQGIQVTVELEGHSDPSAEKDFIQLELTSAESLETELALLKRSLHHAYPEASRPKTQYDWWKMPIFCAGGAGGAMAFHLFGPGAEARGLPFASEWMIQRNLDILADAEVPIGSVIIDCGWSPGGVWEPYRGQWPDLKAFIQRQHKAGIRVLLWLGLWFTEGIPDQWCLMVRPGTTMHQWNPMTDEDKYVPISSPERFWTDAGNPDYLDFVARQVTQLISPDGFDADGFKIDMLQMTPCEHYAQGREHWNAPLKLLEEPHENTPSPSGKWGCEMLYALQKTIHDAAKAAKPDALINSSTVHPYFADTFDMMRLHDTCRILPDTDVFAIMSERAQLAKAALPSHAVDADDWIHTFYDKWLDYTLNSYKLGTPCLFFTEYFVCSFTERPAAQPIPFEDLKRLGQNWKKVLQVKQLPGQSDSRASGSTPCQSTISNAKKVND